MGFVRCLFILEMVSQGSFWSKYVILIYIYVYSCCFIFSHDNSMALGMAMSVCRTVHHLGLD